MGAGKHLLGTALAVSAAMALFAPRVAGFAAGPSAVALRSAFASPAIPMSLRRLPAHLSAASARPRIAARRPLSVPSMVAAAPETSTIVGPEWDNTQEYPSMDSPAFQQDIDKVKGVVEEITKISSKIDLAKMDSIDVKDLISVSKLSKEAGILLANTATYASCEMSLDGSNEAARSVMAQIRAVSSKMTQATQPVTLALRLLPDSVIDTYLKELPENTFQVKHSRQLKDFTLSLPEENVITALSTDGLSSWNQLHSSLSSTLSCDVQGEKMGVAKAAALLASPDSDKRRAAWEGINKAWAGAEESAAMCLNSITGWRAEVNRMRAAKAGKPVHYLDSALHSNRMSRKTLDAMFTAVKEAKPLARKALKLQARALGKEGKMTPSDLMAPPPSLEGGALEVDYPSGIAMVKEAVSTVDPSVGEFVQLMSDNKWVDGRPGEKRAPGAYCTGFRKSRTPRVYLSAYSGSFQSVSTLAHELGHAYHNWVMKDMDLSEASYPMNLAETASIFFETVVGDTLIDKAPTPEEKLQYRWYDAESAVAFLLNIPTRFDFDCAIHQAREDGKTLTPSFLKEQMKKAWEDWYGDSLAEYDEYFWASKLHFHIAGLSFYNFPYTFGYMFALGVYAQQEKQGKDFYENYVALLRDTGRMSAEEVVQKHLGCSIEDPEFWRGSIRIIEEKINAFEELVVKSGK